MSMSEMYVGDDQQMTCGPANTTSNRLSGRSAANAAGDKWSCIAVTHHGSQTHQFIMKIILKQKIIIIRQKYDTVFIILRLIRKNMVGLQATDILIAISRIFILLCGVHKFVIIIQTHT